MAPSDKVPFFYQQRFASLRPSGLRFKVARSTGLRWRFHRPGARTTKAAVKMHTLLDLRGSIPSFIHISDGKLHNVNALDLLVPEAGAIYVMDRAYVDFDRLHTLHLAGAFFVTRAKSNMDAHRVYSVPSDRSAGIICVRPSHWMALIPGETIQSICVGSASTIRSLERP